MTLLGLDFDNTLVRYDKLFYQLALERKLIKESLPADKIIIRNHLRSKGQDEDFTLLQGEVYGRRILEAEPAEGMLNALKRLKKDGVQMRLVSHKTKTPYKGPKYDLHQAAWEWLDKHKFFDNDEIGWQQEQVHFAETKSEKIKIINELKCTHYIDDLEEILDRLPATTKKILYSPNENTHNNGRFVVLKNWEDLTNLI